MTRLRAERVERVEVPDLEVDDPGGDASLLVPGWGSSYGAIEGAARRVRREHGVAVATAYLRHRAAAEQSRAGAARLRARTRAGDEHGPAREGAAGEFLVDCGSYTKVDGLPIFTRDVMAEILSRVGGSANGGGRDRQRPRRADGLGFGQPGEAAVSADAQLAAPPLTKADFLSDQRRAGVRAAATTPSLRRFRRSCPSSASRRSGHRVRNRDRLRRAVRLLHGHLRDARHPRPRASTLATGVATSRPDLSVWVTGDGDALPDRRQPPDPCSAAQRADQGPAVQQPDLRSHQGQYSPTSEEGKVTKSTPRVTGPPFNPVALALGAEATFVARTVDTDKAHMASTLRAAAAHRGAAFVEIYQNCNVFNDGAFDAVRAKEIRTETRFGSSTASRSASAPRTSVVWRAG